MYTKKTTTSTINENLHVVIITKPYFSVILAGVGAKYSLPADAVKKCVQTEGIRGLYKGFLPNWMRIGPHTIVTFFVFEQLRNMVGIQPV